jgi:hypothetical protein
MDNDKKVVRTYTEQKEAKKYSVLINKGELTGIWATLKKLCEDMNKEDIEFPNYWVLAKRKSKAESDVLEVNTSKGSYKIHIEKLK